MQKKMLFLILFFTSVCFAQTERPKIGLVLAGGGAKGCAHLGTLKMLDSLNIPIDYIVGTSMGGIVGALYSIGYSGDMLEKLSQETDWPEIFTDRPPRKELPYFEKKDTGRFQIQFGLDKLKPVTQSGLIYGQKVYLMFAGLTWEYEKVPDFDHLPIPFRCVAVDLVTGDQVILKNGSLAKAMRATMAIPTVFSPVEWGDSLLVDGGLVNNLPIDVVEDMGADYIIAVDVASFLERDKLKTAVDVLEQTFNLVSVESWKENKDKADLFIAPDMSEFSAADFDQDKIKNIIKAGDVAAKACLPKFLELKKMLAKYSQPEPRHILSPDKKDNTMPRIYGVKVDGNHSLPFSFIYNLLGINPGEYLDVEMLDRNIMSLYGLGYFEQINYDIDPMPENTVQINIKVKEHTVRRLRLGMRYDDHYKVVAAVRVQATNFLVPGIRFENELQFAGLLRHRFKAYYPSRGLNFPVYPFFQFKYDDIPIRVTDGFGHNIASYKVRSTTFEGGVGLLFSNLINTEFFLRREYMNTHPYIGWPDPELFPTWKDNLTSLNATLVFDTLDDVLLPRQGFYVNADYETFVPNMDSDVNFRRFMIAANYYHTFQKRHTIRFFGFTGTGTRVPVYRYFVLGHPSVFVGMEYDQLRATNISILRLDYRYQFKKDIFFHFIANRAFDIEINDVTTVFHPADITGFGVGVKLLSPIGPIDIIYSRSRKELLGNDDWRGLTYFVLGYKF